MPSTSLADGLRSLDDDALAASRAVAASSASTAAGSRQAAEHNPYSAHPPPAVITSSPVLMVTTAEAEPAGRPNKLGEGLASPLFEHPTGHGCGNVELDADGESGGRAGGTDQVQRRVRQQNRGHLVRLDTCYLVWLEYRARRRRGSCGT